MRRRPRWSQSEGGPPRPCGGVPRGPKAKEVPLPMRGMRRGPRWQALNKPYPKAIGLVTSNLFIFGENLLFFLPLF